ncbi:hypothetical protein M413DRAFT_21052 [Hebeloma cylindrosporum]|uniref:Uncharacterized protein n=1 Tax=Hebeloma cylindrosporum TaxID=76867 RepID=A0A0C2Z6B1_HEBCY|nr:hypothetical protein M413DRAFT_21052 [Hebeloma cylindrosporum h7]
MLLLVRQTDDHRGANNVRFIAQSTIDVSENGDLGMTGGDLGIGEPGDVFYGTLGGCSYTFFPGIPDDYIPCFDLQRIICYDEEFRPTIYYRSWGGLRPDSWHFTPVSGWVGIVDTSKKDADGKTLQEILVDIHDKFPSYDLSSAEGVEAAIHEIEAKLCPVAKFG